ncbi:alpha/beta hydrolase family protein [Enterocloster lavalensis]|uniref:alpha/beta hydrolase family protein n=1 Tax=Enterocloster lavalensis TaxID=460384 RepID=UPI001D089AF1|nr:S9 family peptidase [Enterocloster lavalensis]MCB6341437.1 S9 family peptidase [Enterocloster lavalensis]
MGYIEKRDILDYKFLSGLCVSSNGNRAVFKVSRACEAENNYQVQLYRLEVSEGGGRLSGALPLEGTVGVGDFCFVDPDHIIFSALKGDDRDRVAQGEFLTVFYSMNLNTGAVEERFRVPLKNAAIELAGPGRFLLTAVGIKDRPDVERMSGEEKERVLRELKAQNDFVVCDELPFMFDGRGYMNGQRRRLYLYCEADGRCIPVTEPLFETSQSAVDPEGRYIAYSGVTYDRFYVRSHGIYLYEIGTGTTKTLLAPGSFQIMGLGFLNGRLVVAAAPWNGEGAFPNHDLYTLALTGGRMEPVHFHREEDFGCKTCGDCKSGKMRTFQSQGGALYYITTKGTGASINRWAPGELFQRLSGPDFLPDSLAVSGEVVWAIGSGGGLQEVYRRKGDGLWERLTNLNDSALENRTVSAPVRYTFTDRDGFSVNGFVIEPADYDPGKSYPGILEIHGGPRAAFTHGFFHELQYLAGKGYFVFYCNPRGSAGGGEDFADIRGRRGTVDYNDLMEWTDFVLDKYKSIDPKRLGVMGGSYGGYMTNWIISHTKRFAAAVSMRSIADLTGSYGATDCGAWGTPGVYGGTPWANDERLREQSPFTYAMNIYTPTLFLHSFEDHRCNVTGAMQMYTALQLKGVPTRMCLFKNECHELSRSGRPASRLRRLEEIGAWMDRYLKL